MARNVCDVELDGCIVGINKVIDSRQTYTFKYITPDMDEIFYRLVRTNDNLKRIFVENDLRSMLPYQRGDKFFGKNIVIKGILWIDKNLITVTDVKYLNSDVEL